MLNTTVLCFTVFVFSLHCTSASRINIADREKEIDLISEILKLNEDQCASDPCQNGGICVSTEMNFNCICIPPYFGEICNKDPCASSPCHNGGKCELDEKGFKCVCKSPFSGETCRLEPCSPNPCENEGKCELIGDNFNCTCKSPYHGDNCELGSCTSNPCQNGGECEEVGDSFKCTCESPFTGATCEQGPCAPNPCQNDGKCYITDEDDFTCLCKEPFTGERCEKGPCSPNPCKNGGNCTIFGNDTSCLCPNAYFGEYCEKGPCSSNPCLNSGSCREDGATFSCECFPPYEGKQCETGPCSSNPCLNNGGCKVIGLNFKCECKPPYTGEKCEMRNTTKPDILMSTSTDSVMTSSITDRNFTDTTDSYNWTSSDSSIVTVDEKPTSTESNSTNDIMSTTPEKGNRNASPKGICETDSDCLNGGTCKNKRGKSSCDCAPNFGGLKCEMNLPCVGLEQSCRLINAVCVLVDNHAICECPNGTLYHKKSGLCEDICDPRKCLHGECEIIGRSYKCNCDHGYTGSHCDEKEKGHHENFIPWFTVLASIGLFICVLVIAMFCVICQIKTFISS